MGGPCIVDGESRDELDNWYTCRVRLDGKEWPSSEHYYQAAKYPGDEEHQEAIRRAPNGTHCWSLGQEERPSLRKDWEEVKVEVMYAANKAKFSQNPALKRLLVSTSGPITAQGSPFWKTWNEVLLERIREELRDFDRHDARALTLRTNMMKGYQQAATSGDHEAMAAATHWAAKRQLPPKFPAVRTTESGGFADSIKPSPESVADKPTETDLAKSVDETFSEDEDCSGSPEKRKIKAVFKKFDTNRNGVIEKDELTQLLQELDAATWTPIRCGMLLRVMDIDSDGVLSYNEFVDWVFVEGPDYRVLRQDFRNAVETIQPGCLAECACAAAPAS